jgi:phosphoenolpyruvate carboxykinase (ATP)
MIFNKVKINSQLSAEDLINQTLNLKQGVISSSQALCIHTGTFTGRSPKDKYIVTDSTFVVEKVDWDSDFNHKISAEKFTILKEDIISYLENKEEIWYRKCYACANHKYQIGLNVYNEYPSSNLFAYNMFIRPEDTPTDLVIADWTIIQAPDFKAEPEKHGTLSSNFSIISFTNKTILIGGSGYTGEIKKGVFTVLNYILPAEFNVLSMHCSANIGSNSDVALFFGLSGTGKTTLSTDAKRKLIGDDEHGWDNISVFNFEGGCYAKVIGLNKEDEPEIYEAIKSGALVENTVFNNFTNEINFNDNSITENTRVSYPIDFIENILNPSKAGIPSTIFFLTCDASGVLPPVSKLSIAQAKYYFLSGYTSKVAGTETGVTQPNPTFSACFGAPFLPLHPTVYAELLGDKLSKHAINVWLINTGWSGASYLTGKRISIQYTRAIINAVLSGKLNQVAFDLFPVFNLNVPTSCPGVPAHILNPLKTNLDSPNYINALEKLAQDFNNNFIKFENEVKEDVRLCAPNNLSIKY